MNRRPVTLSTLVGLIVLALLIPTPTPSTGMSAGQIAFASDRDGNWEIYVMNVDGNDQRNLTNTSTNDTGPAWSPDGSQIAFMSGCQLRSWDPESTCGIYVMNADGSDPRNLTNNSAEDLSPTWSPDGSQIAFASDRDGNSEIYVMNADGSDPRNLTNNSAGDWTPVWSPDGSQIAFASQRDGNWDIYVMNADGSDPRALTTLRTWDYLGAWSPDGSQIAYSSNRGSNYEIYVMNADGSDVRRLTDSIHDDAAPAWKPAPETADH
jgi:Tol biopolymer transport system component